MSNIGVDQTAQNDVHHCSCMLYQDKHYENMPMQYLTIFHCCKNNDFQMKKVDIFLIFAQNVDRGYTLEPLQ